MKIFLPKIRAAFFLKIYEKYTVRFHLAACVVCKAVILCAWPAQEKNLAVVDCTMPFYALLRLGAYIGGSLWCHSSDLSRKAVNRIGSQKLAAGHTFLCWLHFLVRRRFRVLLTLCSFCLVGSCFDFLERGLQEEIHGFFSYSSLSNVTVVLSFPKGRMTILSLKCMAFNFSLSLDVLSFRHLEIGVSSTLAAFSLTRI